MKAFCVIFEMKFDDIDICEFVMWSGCSDKYYI